MGFRSFLHRLTAPKFQRYVHRDQSLKMVFVINHELKMGKGKIAAQVDTLLSKQRSTGKCVLNFSMLGFQLGRKICVKADDAATLSRLNNKQNNIMFFHQKFTMQVTQIPAGSLTVLALGPDEDEKLDALTGSSNSSKSIL